jgi:hypothetical protein
MFTLTNIAASTGNLVVTGNPTVGNGRAGSFGNQFAAAFGGGMPCAIGTSLAPGHSCTLIATFRPTSTGNKGTGTFTSGGLVNVPVASGLGLPTPVWGTGVQAAVKFTWTNDGTVGAWSTATGARTITITNSGPAGSQLSLTAIPAVSNLTGGTQFNLTGGSCSATSVLKQNQTCTVIINRTRPAIAPFGGTGRLTMTDAGAATSPQVLNLSGS